MIGFSSFQIFRVKKGIRILGFDIFEGLKSNPERGLILMFYVNWKVHMGIKILEKFMRIIILRNFCLTNNQLTIFISSLCEIQI